jgi:acyl carrier protein
MSEVWSEERILSEIRSIVLATFDIDLSDRPDTTRIGEIGLDSMAVLDVVMSLEDRLGHKLKNIELPKNPTLHDVAVMVRSNSAQHG